VVIIVCDEDGDFLPMREIQYEAVKAALRKTEGNHTKAAELLGIGRSSLYRLLSEILLGDEPAEKTLESMPPKVGFEIRQAA
jgi:hypothetical protein